MAPEKSKSKEIAPNGYSGGAKSSAPPAVRASSKKLITCRADRATKCLTKATQPTESAGMRNQGGGLESKDPSSGLPQEAVNG